jgi:hypothetical protein
LKEFIDDLLPCLYKLCSLSLSTGQLPASQKAAIVTQILKKQGLDINETKNYRPLSNLTFVAKLIERLVSSRMLKYLNRYDLLPATQSAYRSGHSTETAVLKVASDIWNATNNGHTTLLGLLDLSAAFDTVDHDILLERLHKSFGIGGTLLDWLSSFVTNRTQTVKFHDVNATATHLNQGVPQGSVLGPLLFVLYTADV